MVDGCVKVTKPCPDFPARSFGYQQEESDSGIVKKGITTALTIEDDAD